VYDLAMDLVLMCSNCTVIYCDNYYSASARRPYEGKSISDLSKSRKVKGHLANRHATSLMRRHEGSKFQQSV